MKLLHIFLNIVLLGFASPLIAEEPSVKLAHVAYYAAEVILPFAICGSIIYMPRSEIEQNELDAKMANYPVASTIGGFSAFLLVSNSLIHGCRGLYRELKPITKRYFDKIKQRSVQKTSTAT